MFRLVKLNIFNLGNSQLSFINSNKIGEIFQGPKLLKRFLKTQIFGRYKPPPLKESRPRDSG